MTKICTRPGCEKKRNARGWCSTHYNNWKRRGDPDTFADPEDTRKKQSESAKKRIKRDGVWNDGLTAETDARVAKYAKTLTGREFTKKHRKNIGNSKIGKSSWNNGLTAETDERVAESGKKQSKTKQASPPLAWNDGLTAETDERVAKSAKTLSQTKKKNVDEGTYTSPMQDKKHTDVAKKKNADKHRHPLSAKTIALLIKQRNTPEARKRLQEQYTKNPPPKTRNTSAEKDLRKLLESEKLTFIPQTESDPQKEFDLGFKSHRVDFFIEPNICLEADGDRSHVNPNPHKLHGRSHHLGYKADYVLYKRSDGTWLAKDQWELDRRETKALTKLGNNVLRFWQSELQNNPEECIQRIIEAMKFN